MRLVDYLDKGASLGEDMPCLTMNGRDLSYGEVRRLSWRVARRLAASGVAAGDKVAILSATIRSRSPAFSRCRGPARSGAR